MLRWNCAAPAPRSTEAACARSTTTAVEAVAIVAAIPQRNPAASSEKKVQGMKRAGHAARHPGQQREPPELDAVQQRGPGDDSERVGPDQHGEDHRNHAVRREERDGEPREQAGFRRVEPGRRQRQRRDDDADSGERPLDRRGMGGIRLSRKESPPRSSGGTSNEAAWQSAALYPQRRVCHKTDCFLLHFGAVALPPVHRHQDKESADGTP